MWHIGAFVLWFAICCAIALVFGGAAERSAVLLQIGAAAATILGDGFLSGPLYTTARPALWLIDALLLLLLYRLALNSTRYWPMWVAALQMLSVIAHTVRALDQQMLPDGYYGLVNLVAWPMIGLTAIGALRHFSRRRRFGSDPSFKRSSAL